MKLLALIISIATLYAGGLLAAEPVTYQPLTYEGTAGPGKGKHIVFIASDHEYKSEEALPALARIMAKHHGFKCTVLFGVDPKTGYIGQGISNIPGTEALATADLMVIFTRFQNLPAAQMQPIVDYLDRGGPVIGLRTATHGFQIPKSSPFAKYDWNLLWAADFKNELRARANFGRNVGRTLRSQPPIEHAAGYRAGERKPSGVDRSQRRLGGDRRVCCRPDRRQRNSAHGPAAAGQDAGFPRRYQEKGDARRVGSHVHVVERQAGPRLHPGTYGLFGRSRERDGFRRLLVNAVYWAVGLESQITPTLEIGLVGPLRPTWSGVNKRAAHVKPSDLAGWDSPIMPEAK